MHKQVGNQIAKVCRDRQLLAYSANFIILILNSLVIMLVLILVGTHKELPWDQPLMSACP